MIKKTTISLQIDDGLKNQASKAAEANGENLSTAIRRYLKHYVRYSEKKNQPTTYPIEKPNQNPNIVINEYNHVDIIDI